MTSSRGGLRFAAALMCILAMDSLVTAAHVGVSYVVVPHTGAGQAIAVLWGDVNEIGPETERRIAHAIQIWKNGERAAFIFCVGGSRPSRGYFGARICAQRLAGAGVPTDRIRIGRGSNDTVSNLSEVAEIARSLSVERVVIIASPLQALRGRLFLGAPDGLKFSWSTYDLRTTRPPVGPLALWWEVHYEWVALTSMLLPSGIRHSLINALRE